MVKLIGFFTDCLYKNDGYAVYYFENDNISIVVTGDLDILHPDLRYEIHGEYIEHAKYGLQFKVDFFQCILPDDQQEIIDFLSSPLFKGVSKSLAKAIVKRLNGRNLSYIIDNPIILDDIPRLKNEVKQNILDLLQVFSPEMQQLYMLFQSCQIPSSRIKKLATHYQNNLFDVVFKHPFQLLKDFQFFHFKQIDALASKLDLDPKSIERLTALITFLTIKICFESGDSYASIDSLKQAFCSLEGTLDQFDEVCFQALQDKRIFVEDNRVYHHSQYNSEITISSFLTQFDSVCDCDVGQLRNEFRLLENQLTIQYSVSQLEAIENFFTHNFSIITGGPGCGKTTVIQAITNIQRNLYPLESLVVLAPTGRAAKRIQELCHVNAKTIHSLLVWVKEDNSFVYNETNPYYVDVLVIDECSMVDPYLFSCLLKGVCGVKKIVLIGDEKQLPSISCGNLLDDLIQSDCFTHTVLQQNYRQKQGNDIIQFSQDILCDCVDFNRYQESVTHQSFDAIHAYRVIQDTIAMYLEKNYSINEIQVLAPMYKGTYGIDNLNVFLQKTFNPASQSKKEIRFSKYCYRVGDKVIQNKNRSDLDIYNGDIGFIRAIDDENPKDIQILIDFDKQMVVYRRADLEDISLAYAITVHKSQGSEYAVVLLISSFEHRFMLTKELLYTAVTRARNNCYIIGDQQLFIERAKLKRDKRKTTLTNRILSLYK